MSAFVLGFLTVVIVVALVFARWWVLKEMHKVSGAYAVLANRVDGYHEKALQYGKAVSEASAKARKDVADLQSQLYCLPESVSGPLGRYRPSVATREEVCALANALGLELHDEPAKLCWRKKAKS